MEESFNKDNGLSISSPASVAMSKSLTHSGLSSASLHSSLEFNTKPAHSSFLGSTTALSPMYLALLSTKGDESKWIVLSPDLASNEAVSLVAPPASTTIQMTLYGTFIRECITPVRCKVWKANETAEAVEEKPENSSRRLHGAVGRQIQRRRSPEAVAPAGLLLQRRQLHHLSTPNFAAKTAKKDNRNLVSLKEKGELIGEWL
nr:hypothetical protein Itr_chr02CG08610 [Ipomoea trifida]